MFFSLLRLSLGTANKLPHVPTQDEWEELYKLAKKQAVLGLSYKGIQRLPVNQQPQEELLQQWQDCALITARLNDKLNLQTAKTIERVRQMGYKAVILKGQTFSTIYPEDLQQLRTPGDIDVLIVGTKQDAINVAEQLTGKKVNTNEFKHIDIYLEDNTHAEIHFKSVVFYNPWRNRRWQSWSNDNKDQIFSSDTPTKIYTAIFNLLHIFRHITTRGIGFKQLIDYYFILQQPFTQDELEAIRMLIKALKIEQTAGAVMWVLNKVLGLDQSKFMIEPNAEYGQFLLEEIMLTGNMGKSDRRFSYKSKTSKIRRRLHLLSRYPGEIIFSPLQTVSHWVKSKL